MPLGLAGFDKRELGGATCLVGIDEAGRGCLAGPVVAGAVRIEAAFYGSPWCRRWSREVDDSKRLSPAQRARVVETWRRAAGRGDIRIGIGSATVEEIERHNIFQATALAMRRALALVMDLPDEGGLLAGAAPAPEDGPVVLIDGRPIRSFPVGHRGVVKGDQRSLAIALAGIHAKEWRDGHMRELELQYPGYGFAVHKGYGTAAHVEALCSRGACPVHRLSFLGNILGDRGAEPGLSQDSLF